MPMLHWLSNVPLSQSYFKLVSIKIDFFNTNQDIREVAKQVNQGLMRLITTEDDNEAIKKEGTPKSNVRLQLGPMVEVLTKQLSNKAMQTRVAVLRWVLQLHMKVPNKVSGSCLFDNLYHCNLLNFLIITLISFDMITVQTCIQEPRCF